MIYTLTLNPAVDRELTVPEISFDSVLRATSSQIDFGGKGFNVSRMLQSLGQESVALGFAGGRSGERLREGLESLGIATDFVWVSGETRTNISIVPESHGRYLKVNEPGPTISDQEQEKLMSKISSLALKGDYWVLAGSLPPGVPASFYKNLVLKLQAAGALVLLDTSGAALQSGIQAGPFLIKPNEIEAAQLCAQPVNNDSQVAAAAKIIQQQGCAHVVISRGKHGVFWAAEDGLWLAAAPPINEKNPIGAGDSMVGGLVYGLARGLPPMEALRWGIACGSATASLRGTTVGDRALVERLRMEITVRPWV